MEKWLNVDLQLWLPVDICSQLSRRFFSPFYEHELIKKDKKNTWNNFRGKNELWSESFVWKQTFIIIVLSYNPAYNNCSIQIILTRTKAQLGFKALLIIQPRRASLLTCPRSSPHSCGFRGAHRAKPNYEADCFSGSVGLRLHALTELWQHLKNDPSK